MFSICIPAYNASGHITRCLASIGAQEYQDFEVIIVDDGSEEELVLEDDVLASIGHGGVRLIHTANQGTYAARQTAATMARGDYVFFVDADDELFGNDVLGRIAKKLDAERPDVLLFNIVLTSGQQFIRYPDQMAFGELSPQMFLQEMTLSHVFNSVCSMVFKRSLFKRRIVEERLSYAEDRLQKFDIVRRATSLSLLDEPLYLYREVSTSTTNSSYKPEYYVQACRVEQELMGYFDDIDIAKADWAGFFLSVTCMHLMDVRDSSLLRCDRYKAYELFRNQSVFREATRFASHKFLKSPRYCWVRPFVNGNFLLLDTLLGVRRICRIRR